MKVSYNLVKSVYIALLNLLFDQRTEWFIDCSKATNVEGCNKQLKLLLLCPNRQQTDKLPHCQLDNFTILLTEMYFFNGTLSQY